MRLSARHVALACLSSLALSGCGQGETTTPNQAGAAPAATRPAPTEAEKLAQLASLPAPYNTADLENGRRVFARCRSCHTLPEGAPNMTGPNLWGVFGRQAGGREGYNYSTALKSADFAWDAERLNEWLANPRTFLPGNKMSFAGIPDETDRRDVIAYLKTETGYAPEA